MANPTGIGGPKKGDPSRNPGGRTQKRKDIEALAQKLAEGGPGEKSLLAELAEMSRDPANEVKDRKACGELVMAYAYGKPTQRKEVTGEDGAPLQPVVVYLPDNGRDKPDA